MESEPLMDERESLRVIHAMILSAKKTLQDDGTLYLMWGWLVLFSSLAHYGLLTQTDFPYPYAVWATMPLAGVYTGFYVRRLANRQPVKTYIGEFLSYLWIAFLVSIVILLVFMPRIGYENTYPIILLLYGIGTFVSGGALRFRPLVIGGALNWPIAVAAFFVSFDVQLLLLALAVTCSYIVPGYLLRANYQKQDV
ncbi:hypothetical protein ACO2Q8_15575 [Larkinella sp. VNQ87]|uniref:hypothetical protein n=1 Tax=Larkinella sp. VNQ87 TaxID=3400921 RepID=UPI003C0DDA51